MAKQNNSWVVGAVIVIYLPEQEVLDRLLRTLAGQVAYMAVVDNGAMESTRSFLQGLAAEWPSLEIFSQRQNVGVAAAHNVGIARIRTRGCTHVLLLDQDSIPAPDMVEKLLQACLKLESEGKRVAAVGPGLRYPRTDDTSFFVRFGWLGLKHIYCDQLDKTPIPVDFLISSGSLIPIAALDQVGGMDEQFFIDHVDTEWFLRAASLGYRTYGLGEARMEHSLGKGAAIRLWLGRWRYIAIHSPLRHYYMFRNSTLLYRRNYAPWKWIFPDLIRLILIFFFFLAMSPERIEHGRMMLKGFWDGIRGNTKPPRSG
ncbi:MAG: glycosyltransferase family 2 protein [Thermodesulfobacteriota bacterium]